MRYKYVVVGGVEKCGIYGDEVTTVLASGTDTGNRVSIFYSEHPKGDAPWHYHEIDDEIFYIISG